MDEEPDVLYAPETSCPEGCKPFTLRTRERPLCLLARSRTGSAFLSGSVIARKRKRVRICPAEFTMTRPRLVRACVGCSISVSPSSASTTVRRLPMIRKRRCARCSGGDAEQSGL